MNHSDSHSPVERGKRVKRLRNLANIDRKKTCPSGNFSIATLKNWELGRYGGINDVGAKKILHVVRNEGVDATYEWLMFGLGPVPKLIADFEDKSYLFSKKNNEFINLADEEKQILHEISILKDFYHNIVYFYIPDDLMKPIYQKGDYVAGIRIHPEKIKISKVKNLTFIIKLKKGKEFLGIIKSISKKGQFFFCTAKRIELLNTHISDIACISFILRHYRKNIF